MPFGCCGEQRRLAVGNLVDGSARIENGLDEVRMALPCCAAERRRNAIRTVGPSSPLEQQPDNRLVSIERRAHERELRRVDLSKLKALLRKAAERTVSGVRQAIRRILAGITPTECANFFAQAGYEPS